MHTIVVGVDGSTHGEAALGFAAEEAALREARLLIVSAWEEIPIMIESAGVYSLESVEKVRDDAEGIVQAAVARVAELQPLVACEGKAIQGQPATVLLKEAEDADLIVVGSRGRGGSPASCWVR